MEANAHEVLEIYAIDYPALSGDFWGTPCEAVVFAERLNFKLAVIFPKSISVTVHFVANKGLLFKFSNHSRRKEFSLDFRTRANFFLRETNGLSFRLLLSMRLSGPKPAEDNGILLGARRSTR